MRPIRWLSFTDSPNSGLDKKNVVASRTSISTLMVAPQPHAAW